MHFLVLCPAFVVIKRAVTCLSQALIVGSQFDIEKIFLKIIM